MVVDPCPVEVADIAIATAESVRVLINAEPADPGDGYEFLDRIGQTIYLSATPGPYELQRVGGDVVEQVIRPTGLVDPEVVIKPTKGQIDDLLHEIRLRAERDERVLVTTLTKRMAEDLTDYLLENGVRARYLHSEVDTLRRIELLRELRAGEYDVLVGINLLREGLDLPEVSLVAILDADKEGFLRSGTSLIQTIGRAARNVSGEVHMYADKVTPSMQRAIDETSRRRAKQVAYNEANGINPQPLRKRIADILDQIVREDADTEQLIGGGGRQQSRGKSPVPGLSSKSDRNTEMPSTIEVRNLGSFEEADAGTIEIGGVTVAVPGPWSNCSRKPSSRSSRRDVNSTCAPGLARGGGSG